MKKLKLSFSLLLISVFFSSCPLFKSNDQAAQAIADLAFPQYIQPSNLNLVTDAVTGNINTIVGLQLVSPAGQTNKITFNAAELGVSITQINYKDANGNYHRSKPVFYYQFVSQTLNYPTPNGTNIIQSLPLLNTPITPSAFTFNNLPDPQTGDYDRYLITVTIGYYFRSGEAQYNDILNISPNAQNDYSPTPVNINLQFCVGHRNYYLQSNDNFKTPLIPYDDNSSRWPDE